MELDCVIKPAVHLVIPGSKRREGCGCQTVDVEFQSSIPDTITTISFQNFYTHSLSLQCLQDPPVSNSKSDTVRWKTAITNVQLMPHCHGERGSQGLVILNRAQFQIPLEHVIKLRFILRQPSPDWNRFGISDIKIYSVPVPFHQSDMGIRHRTTISSSAMEQILQNGLETDMSSYHYQSQPYYHIRTLSNIQKC